MDRLRIIFAAILLLVLYLQGVPIAIILILGLFFALAMLYRDKMWKKIENCLGKLPFMPKEPKWLRWVVVFIAFMATYYAVKLVAFYLLGLAGFDVQAELIKSMNVTQ